MALSKEAIRKLRRLQKAILAEPALYNQSEFPSSVRGHDCGTPCCIAGWVVWLENPNPEAYDAALRRHGYFGASQMADALGIDYGQASDLFWRWPKTQNGKVKPAFRKAWDATASPKERAKAGAAYLDAFIESGGTL